jgi:hypothetical protein
VKNDIRFSGKSLSSKSASSVDDFSRLELPPLNMESLDSENLAVPMLIVTAEEEDE